MSEHEIRDGLRGLGLTKDSIALVPSSLRSFGRVAGGAAAVTRAIVAVCGTVVVRSGTWQLTGVPAPPGRERPNNAYRPVSTWDEFDRRVRQAVPFSPDLPIDRELGVISEAVRRSVDHVQGHHPLFSFLATGPLSEEVIADVRLDWPLRPIEALAELDGEVLLLGVGHAANTAVHLAEQRLGRSRFYRYAKLAPGVWGEFPNIPGESHRFDDLEPALRASTREVTIGTCRARRVRVRDVLQQATAAVVRDAGALLCDDDECRCVAARRQREEVLGR